jgi:adenosylmethionine-8-amino-7-oxononanoate aminotransferase
MSEYDSYPPSVISSAKGVWLRTADGRKILDAVSSWWVNLFGHGDRRIRKAITAQLKRLEHVIFANYTHEPAARLAHGLSVLFPGLDRVFLSDNGSTAVEVAIKMAFQYRIQTGEPERDTFVYLSGGYHGETIGALSIGSLGIYKDVFGKLCFPAVEAEGPDCFRCPYGLDRASCSAECFEKAERVLEERSKNIAAVVVEPILQAASGMRMYPPVYLKKLREATVRRGIHLICDEVAAGFGRTGRMMATHHAESVVPDFVCLSKGLTGGFLGLGATLTNGKIYSAFLGTPESGRAFLHSHSYTGNPIACSAACAVLDIFGSEDVLGTVSRKGGLMEKELGILTDHPSVGEIRRIGMVAAIELVADRKTKRSFDPTERIGYRVYREAEKNGVLLRNLGDVLYFMPPYCISRKETRFMVRTAARAIVKVLGRTIG